MSWNEGSSLFYSPICCHMVSLLRFSPRGSRYSHGGLRLTWRLSTINKNTEGSLFVSRSRSYLTAPPHTPRPWTRTGDERASVDAVLLRPFARTPFLTTLESNPGDLWPPVNGNSTPGIAFSIG